MRPKKHPHLKSAPAAHGSPIVASFSIPCPATSFPPQHLPSIIEGRIQSSTLSGPFVEWSGSSAPTMARVLWMERMPDWSRCTGLRVALAFEGGQESRPVVVGLFEAPPPNALATAPPRG